MGWEFARVMIGIHRGGYEDTDGGWMGEVAERKDDEVNHSGTWEVEWEWVLNVVINLSLDE